MKKITKHLCFFGFFLFFSLALKAQTIIELNKDNVNMVATQIYNLISSNSAQNPPSIQQLREFLDTPFTNRFYGYNSPNCSTPGLQVVASGPGMSLAFNNIANTQGDLIFVGALQYGGFMPFPSFAVHDSVVYNGISYFNGELQFRIIMVGKYCSSCSSGPIPQCMGNLEVIIVDKNIL